MTASCRQEGPRWLKVIESPPPCLASKLQLGRALNSKTKLDDILPRSSRCMSIPVGDVGLLTRSRRWRCRHRCSRPADAPLAASGAWAPFVGRGRVAAGKTRSSRSARRRVCTAGRAQRTTSGVRPIVFHRPGTTSCVGDAGNVRFRSGQRSSFTNWRRGAAPPTTSIPAEHYRTKAL